VVGLIDPVPELAAVDWVEEEPPELESTLSEWQAASSVPARASTDRVRKRSLKSKGFS
jgi:hypothetical protein